MRGKRTHVFDIVDDAVTGSLRTDEGTPPVGAFASEYTSELISEFLVCPKEVANLASASTNITS
jgi:hypothetical protein